MYNVNVGDNINFKTHDNVTDFHLEKSSEGSVYYYSENTSVNLYVCAYDTSMCDSSYYTIQHECSNPTNVNGYVVYLSSSNTGVNAGQVRYVSYINDRDNQRIILVSTPDMNETSYIISHITVA